MSESIPSEIFLTTEEAAKLLKRGKQTLINERHKNIGLPYVRINGSIRYLLSDIMELCQNNRIVPIGNRNIEA